MILSDLIKKLDYELLNGDVSVEVNELRNDSRKVGRGDVFVCIKGAVSDGHRYIDSVAGQGAAAIIVSDDVTVTDSLKDVTIVKTNDTRLALAYMSAEFFGNPAGELFTIGITGTKGKTTTSVMVREILEACGIKTGLIGTIETMIGDEHIPSENTTPESYLVQKYFRKMADAGCRCVVMEVSSQALMLHRTAGIDFDIGVLTNLEPDHIGPNEHKDFEEYLMCKSKLFQMCKVGIVNADDEHWKDIVKNATCQVKTYGTKEADMVATDIEHINTDGDLSMKFHASGILEGDVIVGLPGKFNVYNGMCAACVGALLGMPQDVILHALEHVEVRGRVEEVSTG